MTTTTITTDRPLALSDDDLATIRRYAEPLPAGARSAFLQEVAAELRAYPEVGEGLIGRVAAVVQRKHFHAPELHGNRGGTRWSR